jgi:hypothetical protein
VSWEKSFAGYALIRLLTTIPITPGGLGITEVGLTAYLASGLGNAATDRVAAAILLARALTFVVPIPFGALNFAVWRWLRRKDAAADLSMPDLPPSSPSSASNASEAGEAGQAEPDALDAPDAPDTSAPPEDRDQEQRGRGERDAAADPPSAEPRAPESPDRPG